MNAQREGAPARASLRMPALIALVSSAGLVSALLGDGAWDVLSWLALGGAVAVGAWHALRRAPSA